MLAVILYFVVAAVTVAIGRNIYQSATEASQIESELLGMGEGYAKLRSWSHRFGGAFLMVLGVFLAVGGVASAWHLISG